MVNTVTQSPAGKRSPVDKIVSMPTPPLPPEATANTPQEVEEKVEVSIRESIRINPRDFSAFKHALEDFVNNWDI